MVIANNCIGAYCYKCEDGHRPTYEYDNPFIGNLIFENSFYKILKNFESIDWENPKYCSGNIPFFFKNDIYNYVSLMDDEIRIYYRHYEFKNMIIHWEDRVPRMLKFMKTESQWKQRTLVSFVPVYDRLRNQVREIHDQYRHRIYDELGNECKILVSKDKNFYESHNIIHTPFNEYEHTYDVSEWIYENYPKYITNEWD